MDAFPLIPEGLIEELARVYPDKAPPLDMPLETIRYKSGQVSVVNHLRNILNHQTKGGPHVHGQ